MGDLYLEDLSVGQMYYSQRITVEADKQICIEAGFRHCPDILHHTEQVANFHIIGIAADLGHVANAAPVRWITINGLCINKNLSAVGLNHAQDGFDECGLTGAIRSYQ